MVSTVTPTVLAAMADGRILDDVEPNKPKWGREFGKVGQ